MVVIVLYLNLQLSYMQSVPITTKVVNLNPAHDKVFLIQHYVIKFVSDLQQVSGFLQENYCALVIFITCLRIS
jgi:hypothetical protein